MNLQILVHLFLVSRRVPPPKAVTPRSVSTPSTTPAGGESKAKDVGPISLTSTVLDTLSCILVDSSPSLRAFEDVGGLKSVVKIMKRQGTTREVKSAYLLIPLSVPSGLMFTLGSNVWSFCTSTSTQKIQLGPVPRSPLLRSQDPLVLASFISCQQLRARQPVSAQPIDPP